MRDLHRSMRRLRWFLGTCLAANLTLSAPVAVAHPAGIAETADDPRNIPIPPVDRSREPVIVLRGGTLITDPEKPVIPNSVVIMQGDRVVAAGPADSTPMPQQPARVIDTTGLTVMPGLIDLHIHFTQQRGTDIELFADSESAIAIRGTALARQLVEAGITGARDMGTASDIALRLKQAVERRIIRGPRIVWAGSMIVATAGHGDAPTRIATNRESGPSAGSMRRIANGPGDWRLAVREQLRKGADWVKIAAPYNRDEMSAAIEEAHRDGTRVAVDSYGEYTDWALEAGVDSLEHPLALTDKAVPLMVRHRVSFVPTLGAFENLMTTGYPTAHIPAGGFYYTRSRRFRMDPEVHSKRVLEAYRAGVPIGVGTDIPFENDKRYPDAYFLEMEYLKKAGMPNKAILASATSVGARIIGLGDRLGTIQPGKIADIIVVRGDPLADLAALRAVRYVVADGDIVVDDGMPKK